MIMHGFEHLPRAGDAEQWGGIDLSQIPPKELRIFAGIALRNWIDVPKSVDDHQLIFPEPRAIGWVIPPLLLNIGNIIVEAVAVPVLPMVVAALSSRLLIGR